MAPSTTEEPRTPPIQAGSTISQVPDLLSDGPIPHREALFGPPKS